jgi:hypothetical protein
MRLLSRLATVAVVFAAVATALASPAAAAPTYWKFKNVVTQQCLTAGKTDVVYLRSCVVSDYQEWDWIYSGTYKALRNRGNGHCLMTDHENVDNAVWTSACGSGRDGQRWAWINNKWLQSNIGGFLRSTTTEGRVRAHEDWFNDRADWVGYTV